MGIISKFKKRLPIIGGGSVVAKPTAPASTPLASTPRPPAAPEEAAPDLRGGKSATVFIEEFVKSNAVAIFMKGSPAQPMCGFSANASAILASYGHDLAHFDVFTDPEVREGVKQYSNWPTIPQIYVGGEFLGGSDIVAQMHAAGELGELIEAAAK
jgi:monothiol glutaredoxin